ncbi:MAG: hypothetical protein FJ098_11310, partial [Deltaproteobacteria bacterium]|nr:hypothetical protein [Deltaproteobacteria bacterium]
MSGKMRMVFSPERSAALGRSLLDAGIAPDLRRMFGHEVFFLNGYMFAGACLDGVFVHLGADAVQDALAREPGVAAFSPADGMTMKDYLLLGPAIADDAGRLR